MEDFQAAEAAEGGVAEGDDAAVVQVQLADVVAAEEALCEKLDFISSEVSCKKAEKIPNSLSCSLSIYFLLTTVETAYKVYI